MAKYTNVIDVRTTPEEILNSSSRPLAAYNSLFSVRNDIVELRGERPFCLGDNCEEISYMN